MKPHTCEHRNHKGDRSPAKSRRMLARWRSWLFDRPLVAAALALCWLALRSGTKPSRLAYPCQRAAMGTACLALGVPITTTLIAVRRSLARIGWARLAIVGAIVSALFFAGFSGRFRTAGTYLGPRPAPVDTYRAKVFHVTNCQYKPTGDRFTGLDNLIGLMGRDGLKFYKSEVQSLTSGPAGIVGSSDVVIIKINYQWTQRGGTNVDLLSGLIRRIVDHPDGFSGEIVVCENGQFAPLDNFDHAENNAEDHGRSPHDVVAAFKALGYNVSHYDWTLVRGTAVGEYSAGDMADGYVVHDYNPAVGGRVSYPKFHTENGTYISLRYGIWNPVSHTYDRQHLKFINVPVLKSHHAVYGVTACVKHYMGVVTDLLSTNSHNSIATGILGALIGEIHPADLNILDAIYINANPTSGPGTSYTGATRRQELVASVDPVAADMWSVKNILIPAFVANGYSPPWPAPSADPDNAASTFRHYLDNSMYQILAAGDTVTNDLAQIDAFTANGRAGDFDNDGDVDSLDYAQFVNCFTGPGGGPVGPACLAGDFDGDGDVDCADWQGFAFAWTGPGSLPQLPQCIAGVGGPHGKDADSGSYLGGVRPNPSLRFTTISYNVGAPGSVSLRIFDMTGRAVRTLVNQVVPAGEYSAAWDGTNDGGARVASGTYFCRLDAPGRSETRKIVLSR